MSTIELFPQGGLGNQLIQYAYASSLSVSTGADLTVNPVLLSRAWSKMRGISPRTHSQLLLNINSLRSRKADQLQGLLRLYSLLGRQSCITDSVDYESARVLILSGRRSVLPMYGYFQHHQAFTGFSKSFWKSLSLSLSSRYFPLEPRPFGQVALHVRMGDYRLPENVRLFFQPHLIDLINAALCWRSSLGGTEPIALFTDDPTAVRNELPVYLESSVEIFSGMSPEVDFLQLACYQHLISSNSTFSLCAGRLSSELWGLKTTVAHPDRWFINPQIDSIQQRELRQSGFCVPFSNILS